jgi:hypothetical protein
MNNNRINSAYVSLKDHRSLFRKNRGVAQISFQCQHESNVAETNIMFRKGVARGILWAFRYMQDFIIIALCIAAIGFLFPWLESLPAAIIDDFSNSGIESEFSEVIDRYYEVIQS